MSVSWADVFDHFGIKRVTDTDKRKFAYLPSKGQRDAIEAAGVHPAAVRPGQISSAVVLWDSNRRSVEFSYYYAARSAQAKRRPEPRMGRAIISAWLEPGDRVVIGNITSKLFAFKMQDAPAVDQGAVVEVLAHLNRATLFARAKQAPARPGKRSVRREDFIRNPYVSAAALARAKNKCEMPGCAAPLFSRDDGRVYLEVHHVVPLSENGDDAMANVAALCPRCHRELHFGKDRAARRATLAAYVGKLKVR